MVSAAGRPPSSDDHLVFRDSVRRFIDREVLPHDSRWEAADIVDRCHGPPQLADCGMYF